MFHRFHNIFLGLNKIVADKFRASSLDLSSTDKPRNILVYNWEKLANYCDLLGFAIPVSDSESTELLSK